MRHAERNEQDSDMLLQAALANSRTGLITPNSSPLNSAAEMSVVDSCAGRPAAVNLASDAASGFIAACDLYDAPLRYGTCCMNIYEHTHETYCIYYSVFQWSIHM